MGMRGPLRQSQIIAPFGPGSMHTDRFGISLICCGLDHWFDEDEQKDIQEFIIDDEWRIQRDLRVQQLRLPPDYRRSQTGVEVPNIGMTIPFLRFPTWHYCSVCGKMEKTALTYQGTGSQKICPVCFQKNSIKNPLVQVRFIAVCKNGHIMEFPWKEWAHQSHSPECNDDSLRLVEYGGGTLDSIEVSCTCGKSRRLSGITSSNLSVDGEEFSCTGQRLWLHDEEGSGCGKPIRGSLRNASNIYFADVFSSIFLPRHSAPAEKITPTTAELITIMERPSVSARLDTMLELDVSLGKILTILREKHPLDFKEYSDEEISVALKQYTDLNEEERQNDVSSQGNEPFDRESFRLEEYKILTQEWDEPYLMSRTADMTLYSNNVRSCFSKIMLIHKLRETRVFRGFTRLSPVSDQSLSDLKNNLWLEPPGAGNSWLPAAIVHGEGLFFEFNSTTLQEWLKGDGGKEISQRIECLSNTYIEAIADRPGFEIVNELHPAFIMIHTFAHLLMNQLTYECGYSSASLRERLYFSSDEQDPMAGLLIYTAAGDSEGTMGGLVRMGLPELFEPLLKQAVQKAQWCSADPVCMELGKKGGQGPNSCNLAACHNCALVPETACVEFNRFLDRGVVTGTVENRDMGFFNMFTA